LLRKTSISTLSDRRRVRTAQLRY